MICNWQSSAMRIGMLVETRTRRTGDGEELLPQTQAKKARKESVMEKTRNIGFVAMGLVERTANKKLISAFALLMLVAFVFLVRSHCDILGSSFSSDSRRLREPRTQKIRQTCNENHLLRWMQASNHVRSLKHEVNRDLRVGLVNFKDQSMIKWELFSGGLRPNVFKFKSVDRKLNWSDFFPEQIEEAEDEPPAKCPDMPLPVVPVNLTLDLLVASIPCDKSSSRDWKRDVDCLQAFLAAAKVAAETGSEFLHVVLCGDCRPIPNLFICSELLEEHDGVWLYKLNLKRIRKQLELPVGSCELALPAVKTRDEHNISREAYATILHSAESYVCGAISLAHSIRRTGSTRDMVILVDKKISPEHRAGLEAAGWKVFTIDRIRNPKAEPKSYNEWNYSKFRLWQLTQYKKLIYIDADIILLRNLDLLFELPEISATRNDVSLFNSGVMVIQPSNCTFDFLVNHIDIIQSYNGGDQGFLNEVYTWWHRLPGTMNFLKHFDNNTVENERKLKLFTAEPPQLYAMHFLGIKPWLCFRDYDCNWNQNQLHIFANDEVHAQWWKLHDTMPANLQQMCVLNGKQKFLLEWDIIKAARKKYPDMHWKREIMDPRWHSVQSEST